MRPRVLWQLASVSFREFLRTRSADLIRLAGPTWSLDTFDHSNAMTLSATVLALVLLSRLHDRQLKEFL